MNEKLKEFLEGLSEGDAIEIWAWLDDDPYAVGAMIKCIADALPPDLNLLPREEHEYAENG